MLTREALRRINNEETSEERFEPKVEIEKAVSENKNRGNWPRNIRRSTNKFPR